MTLDKEIQRLRRIQEMYEAEIMAIRGVRGMGISSEAGIIGFTVLVDQEASRGEKIPSTLQGIPVRIVHVQDIVAQDSLRPGGSKGRVVPR